MNRLLIITLLAFSCGTAWAAKKPVPVYQDGVLKDFHTEQKGTYCSTDGDTNGTVRATTDDDGNTHGTVDATSTASTSCIPRIFAYYTVVVGDHTFVLSPTWSGHIIFAAFFRQKNSVLYGVLPGTPIKMRTEGGAATGYIKVGKRESEYTIVSMK
jgi:hypothetical protein